MNFNEDSIQDMSEREVLEVLANLMGMPKEHAEILELKLAMIRGEDVLYCPEFI